MVPSKFRICILVSPEMHDGYSRFSFGYRRHGGNAPGQWECEPAALAYRTLGQKPVGAGGLRFVRLGHVSEGRRNGLCTHAGRALS
jgi:hypothetical protein